MMDQVHHAVSPLFLFLSDLVMFNSFFPYIYPSRAITFCSSQKLSIIPDHPVVDPSFFLSPSPCIHGLNIIFSIDELLRYFCSFPALLLLMCQTGGIAGAPYTALMVLHVA